MTDLSGKVLTLTEVLKIGGSGRPFRAKHIYEQIGISRQLTHYYINNLLDDGFITKQGVYYVIQDTAGILTELQKVDRAVNTPTKIPDKGLIKNPDKVNAITMALVQCKAFSKDFPWVMETIQEVTALLKETIDALDDGIKFLNKKSYAPSTARKFLREKGQYELWETLSGVLESKIDKEQFLQDVEVVINDE